MDAEFNEKLTSFFLNAINFAYKYLFIYLFSSTTVRRPISPELDAKCRDILERIAPHYEYHGISIKSCYEDFDRHNIGTITESQVRQLPYLTPI